MPDLCLHFVHRILDLTVVYTGITQISSLLKIMTINFDWQYLGLFIVFVHWNIFFNDCFVLQMFVFQETEDWEEKNATLEQEISKLHQQKEQLEFILEAHKAMCRQNKANKQTATTSTATSTCSLETPTAEVVTPTSVFNYSVANTVQNGESGETMSCGREAIKSESSGSDMSSPDSNRTLIQLWREKQIIWD